MPAEHPIRLRSAWDWHDVEGGREVLRRIVLPTPWPIGLSGPIRLSRGFGRPPIDPDRESLALRLESVAGLREVRLNGRPLARLAPGTEAIELPLDDPLPDRNLLELEIDPTVLGTGAGEPRPWGAIALIVRRR